jgi:predicted SprT family Zn-dependent metalloprotease
MCAKESTMCVNPGFFELKDPNSEEEKDHMMKQLSVIVRHELLHYLLEHEIRFIAYLKKKFPHS